MSSARRALRTIADGVRELLSVRWVRVVLSVAALAIVARSGLEFALARTLNSLAGERGLTCTWEDLDLSLVTGRGEVRFLALGPRAEAGDGARGPALLEIEYGVFDLELSALLSGQLHVRRAEVDGLDARIERDADGTWNFERHVALAEVLALIEPTETDDSGAQEEDTEPHPINLRPPLAIEALRAQDARLHLVDRAASPPVDLVLEAHVGLSNLSTSARPARFSATVTGNRVLDGAHVDGELAWIEDGLRLTAYVQAGGLRPRAFAPWLDSLDVRPACDSLEGRLRAEIELRVVGEQRDQLQARVTASEVRLETDGEESLALDALTIEVERASARGVSVPSGHLSGVRGRASLLESGAIRVAGFELLPRERVATGEDWMSSLVGALERWSSSSVPRWAALLVRSDPDAYPWSLGTFTVDGGELRLTDHTVTPPVTFPLFVDQVRLGTIVHDPARESAAIPITVAMRAPGMAETIRVEGEIDPFAPRRAIDLSFEAGGIGLAAMAPHLERAGLERGLREGRFQLRLVGEATTNESGRTEGWISLDKVGLSDGTELFGVRSVKAQGLLLDPEQRLMRMGDVEITGPRLSFARDPSNELVAFGLRTLGLAPTAQETAPVTPAGGAPSSPTDEQLDALLPVRFEVGRLAWRDSDVLFVDETTEPPLRFNFDELGFELTDLTIGADPAGPAPAPARFVGRAVAPGVFDELTLEGLVHSRPGAFDLTGELALRGTGLQGRLVAPYLRVLGIEPALENGRLAMDVVAHVRQSDGWEAGLTLADAALTDGGQEVWTLGQLRVSDLRLGETISIGEVVVIDPFLRLAREPGGAILAGGLRLPERAAAPQGETETRAGLPALTFPSLPAVELGRFTLTGGRVAWTDASFSPALETELAVELVQLEDLATDGREGAFELLLHVGDTVESARLSGTLELGPAALGLSGSASLRGIGAGQLARMLPPGVALECADGRLDAHFEARLAPAQSGGLSLRVEGSQLTVRDGEGEPTVKIGSFGLALPRVDTLAGTIEVGPAHLEGVALDVWRDLAGAMHVGGLRLESVEAQPAEEEASEGPSPAPPLPGRLALVGDASLHVERFTFRDEGLGAKARMFTAELRAMVSPCVLIDEAPQELAPIDWEVVGSVEGLIERWRVNGSLAPFAAQPRLVAALEATGVRTAGLVELVPALAERVQGTVEQGHVSGRLEATLPVRRARPTELGLSRPFGAEIALDELAYRAAPDGEVLAGVDHVRADVERVDTRQGLVHVKTIEVRRPQGVVRRNGMAVKALGLEIALVPEESTGPAEPEAPPTEAPTTEPATPQEPSGEFRIDELLVTDVDFHIWDEAGERPLHIAPASLDAEVKRLTTRALTETRPIQFSAILEGAKRDGVFEELALAGRVSLYPEPSGWVSVSLAGLELPHFAGVAAEQGVEIGDGALDADLRLRLRGAEGARVHTSLTFSDLELSELEGGPIESALGLSVPLESALFLLRNADGEHRITTGFSVDRDGLSRSQIVRAGTQAVAGVLAGALVGAPLRLLGLLIPDGDAEERPPRERWRFDFAPGSTELGADAAERLAEARRKLSGNGRLVAIVRHELTVEDLACAERLANPSGAECLELVQRLRQRKAELLRRGTALRTEARTLYAVGADEARAVTAELRGLERDLASIEDGLDHVLQIVRYNSPRQRGKRTRGACRQIADLRIAAIEALLRGNLAATDQERIDVRAPRFDPLERAGGGGVVVELRRQ